MIFSVSAIRALSWWILSGLALAPVALLGQAAGAESAAADQAFDQLVAAEWAYQMEHNPVWASLLGDRRFNDRWSDLSRAGREQDRAHNAEVLARLDAIGREALSSSKRLDLDLLRYDYAGWVEEDDLGGYLMPVSHLGWLPEGFRQRAPLHTAHQLGAQLRFTTRQDFDEWIRRLEAFPRYVDDTIAALEEGLQRGRVRPKVVVERLIPLVRAQISVDPKRSGFFQPCLSFPETMPAAEKRRLWAYTRRTVAEDAMPALQRYLDFLTEQYLPAAPDSVALSDVPGGAALYAYYVRKYTTTARTPDQIHQLGLEEVARIRGEMDAVRREVGFGGSLEAFFEHLRTDPRFFYQQSEDLLTGYRSLAKRVDPLMVRLFGRLPRMPYGVEPIDAAIAPQATTGYYFPASQDGARAGTYQVNLFQPESRPKWEMVPLTLHEAMPGHHLQVSLAAEQEGLSTFRRFNYHSAYSEGWGLYAEWLGYELGLYDDPYDRFGQLAYEMWRAVRLVVDTGMHAKGWSRERAIRYFLDNSPRPELDVINEIDRYIALPAQALSYKIGQIEIRELRRRAETELGDAFDLRAFHDLVLGAGSMPLVFLRQRVEEWIAATRSTASLE